MNVYTRIQASSLQNWACPCAHPHPHWYGTCYRMFLAYFVYTRIAATPGVDVVAFLLSLHTSVVACIWHMGGAAQDREREQQRRLHPYPRTASLCFTRLGTFHAYAIFQGFPPPPSPPPSSSSHHHIRLISSSLLSASHFCCRQACCLVSAPALYLQPGTLCMHRLHCTLSTYTYSIVV